MLKLKISVLLVLVIAGCGTTRDEVIDLEQDNRASIQTSHAFLIFDQEQNILIPRASNSRSPAPPYNTAGSMFDPLGYALGVAIGNAIGSWIVGEDDAPQYRELPDSRLAFTQEQNFLPLYERQFKKVVNGSQSLITEYDLLASNIKKDKLGAKIASIKQDSSLVIRTKYFFSTDYRRIYVNTHAILTRAENESEPIYQNNFLYVSYAVGKKDMSMDDVIREWSESDSKRFRMVMSQGIKENFRMINMALLDKGATLSDQQSANDHILFWNPEGRRVEISGAFVAKDDYRRVLKSVKGNYYSVDNPNRYRADLEKYLENQYRSSL
ncbi:hypothetical protein [Kaarinaea lacus]